MPGLMQRYAGVFRKLAGRSNAQRWLLILVTGGTLALLALFVWRNRAQFLEIRWQLDAWAMLLALPLYPLAIGASIAAWHRMLRHLGQHTHWRQDVRITFASNIAKRLPTPVWFVAGRVLLYREIGVPAAVTSLAVLVEAVLVLFSGLLMAALSMVLFWPSGPLDAMRAWGIALVAVCLVLVLRPQFMLRAADWLAARLGHGQRIGGNIGYAQMLLWTGYNALGWVVGGAIYFLLVRALYPLSVDYLPRTIAVWVVGGVVSHVAVFTPGGLGLKELTLTALLSTVAPVPVAVAAAVLSRLWFTASEFLWFGLTRRLDKGLRSGEEAEMPPETPDTPPITHSGDCPEAAARYNGD
ncbi:MAG: lysylphosphatidylglycerol synthase domain-containing protein [Anaerolineae bacterium]